MGLFDSWRRKREQSATVRLEKPAKPLATPETSENQESATERGDTAQLIAEYERLMKRREELQLERRDLTSKLDQGQLDANEFRKQLMDRIQEAAQVSENLRAISTKLISLGYRGVSH